MKRKILLIGSLFLMSLVGCSRVDSDDNTIIESNASIEESIEETSAEETSAEETLAEEISTEEIATYEAAVERECVYKEIRKIYDENNIFDHSLEVEYDSQGNVLKYINYDGEGNLESYEVYGYNEQGKKTIYEKFDSEGVRISFSYYENNEQGDVIKAHNASYLDTYEYIYDENDRVIEKLVRKNGEFSYRKVYTYDAEGKVIEEKIFDEQGEIVNIVGYIYDKNGNLEYEDEKYNDIYGCQDTRYTYDDNNNLIEKVLYSNDDVIVSRVYKYEYDDKGNCIKKFEYDRAGNLDSEMTYKYDEKGRQIECINVDYKYDSACYRRTHEYIEMD